MQALMLNSNFRLKSDFFFQFQVTCLNMVYRLRYEQLTLSWSDLHTQLNINDIIYRTLFTEAHMVPAVEASLYSVYF